MAIIPCGLHIYRADIDECASDKCHGGNECKNGINQFECICSDGWQEGGINSTCEGVPFNSLKFIFSFASCFSQMWMSVLALAAVKVSTDLCSMYPSTASENTV